MIVADNLHHVLQITNVQLDSNVMPNSVDPCATVTMLVCPMNFALIVYAKKSVKVTVNVAPMRSAKV